MTPWLQSLRTEIPRPKVLLLAVTLGIFEGADLSSMGLTLSRLSKVLSLDSSQAGLSASASLTGLVVGAFLGGRWVDLRGRRAMMIVATVMLGLFSCLTILAWNFQVLFAIRLLAGCGIGGLIPMLVAMGADSATPRFRSTAIGIVMASGTVGGIIVGFVAMASDWRWVFGFGGIGPLLLLPFLFRLRLSDTEAAARISAPRSFGRALFGEGRLLGSLLIWAVSFCTVFISYVMINWLPSLQVRQGMSENQSHVAAILYAAGGIVGNLCAGRIVDRGVPAAGYIIGYGGAALCLAGLSVSTAPGAVFILTFGAGVFILGAQLITYSLTPTFYPHDVRTTGLGAMIAAGRFGSVFGPVVTGTLLHAGFTPGQVFLGLIPGFLIALAFAGCFLVVRRGQSVESKALVT